MEEENKTSFEEKIDQVEDKIEDFVEKVEDKIEETVDKLEDKFEEKKEAFEAGKDEREAKKEEFKEDLKEKAEQAKEKAEEAKEKVAEALKTEDESAAFEPDDINGNKIMAAISYLGILVIIPIIAAKDSKFVRFHANQGLILLLCEVVCTVLGKIPVIKIFASILDICLLALAIYGIYNVIKGKAKRLPFIGKFDLIK